MVSKSWLNPCITQQSVQQDCGIKMLGNRSSQVQWKPRVIVQFYYMYFHLWLTLPGNVKFKIKSCKPSIWITNIYHIYFVSKAFSLLFQNIISNCNIWAHAFVNRRNKDCSIQSAPKTTSHKPQSSENWFWLVEIA